MTISPYSITFTTNGRGHAERHRVAVEIFVTECVRDPETQRIFATVRKDAGLGRKAAQLQFIEAVTKGTPFPGFAQVKRRIDSTIEAYAAGRTKRQFPWLGPLLVAAFVRDVGERAYGKPATLRYRLESLTPRPALVYDPPAWLSAAEEGRLAKEALHQFRKVRRQYEQRLQANSRRPRPNVARNVVWFYRHIVQGVQKHELAREYCENCKATGSPISGDGHEIVSQGLKEAARLLGSSLPSS